MEYRYNDRYEKLCEKYCVDTTIDIYGSLISPYSTITISLSDFDNDEEIAFMTAYAISMDEIEEDDLSIFDIFDEIDSDQTEAGYAIEKYLEKNFNSLHSKYFEYFDGLKDVFCTLAQYMLILNIGIMVSHNSFLKTIN